MIDFLLQRLMHNPFAEISHRDVACFGDAVDGARRMGLLEPTTIGPTAWHSGRLLTVTESDGTFELFDPEDPEFPEIVVSEGDLSGYRVNLDVLAQRLARHLGLDGPPARFSPNLLFLGSCAGIPVSLGLANETRVSGLASELHARLGAAHPAQILATPTRTNAILHAEWLGRGMQIACLCQDGTRLQPDLRTCVMSLRPASDIVNRDPELGLTWGPGFNRVNADGVEYVFTTNQSLAVELLVHAAQAGIWELSQTTILARLGREDGDGDSSSRELRDVFRVSRRAPVAGGGTTVVKEVHGAWDTLIVPGRGKGTFMIRRIRGPVPDV